MPEIPLPRTTRAGRVEIPSVWIALAAGILDDTAPVEVAVQQARVLAQMVLDAADPAIQPDRLGRMMAALEDKEDDADAASSP